MASVQLPGSSGLGPQVVWSVDQRLGAVGDDLRDERGSPRDAGTRDKVAGRDIPAGGALRAYRDGAVGQNLGE
jgi:hypothetical protein